VALSFATGEGDNVSLNASLDLGLELRTASGWVVGFGTSLFERDGMGVGLWVPR